MSQIYTRTSWGSKDHIKHMTATNSYKADISTFRPHRERSGSNTLVAAILVFIIWPTLAIPVVPIVSRNRPEMRQKETWNHSFCFSECDGVGKRNGQKCYSLACLLGGITRTRTRTIPPRRSFDYTFRLPRDTAVRLEHGLGWFWNLKNFKVLRCCWSSRLYIVHGTRQHFSWFSPYNPKTTLINGWVESANNFLFRIVCHVFPLFSIHRWRYKRGMCV